MIKFITQTLPGIKYFSFWVLLLGILFYFFGYFKFWGFSYIWIYDFLETLGSVFMSSAVFMGIVKSYQFTGIFKDELRKVVFAEDHLSERKDLDTIWEKVTLQLCKQKFNKISSKLNKVIKDYYLPIEDDYYYKDSKLDVQIEYYDGNDDYIVLTEEHTFNLIIEDSECVDYVFSSSVPFSEKDNDRTQFKLLEMSIDGESLDVSKLLGKELKMKRTNNVLNVKFSTKINCKPDKKEYVVYRKQQKIYSIKDNHYKSFLASWLYENFHFHITYPKSMVFDWEGIGVLGKWNVNRTETTYSKTLKANYKGLMFKNQGFMLFFKEY